MSFFDIFKGLGKKNPVVDTAAAELKVAAPADIPALEQKAADAIKSDILKHNLNADGLDVSFDATNSTVTVSGEAADQATKEKIILCCGNVGGVKGVQDEMSVTAPSDPARYYTIVSGDSLSKVSLKYYGDANKYRQIVDANQPMIVDENKIYPGQVVRIPPPFAASAPA